MPTPQLVIIIGVAAVAATLAVGLMGSSKSNWGANFLIAIVGSYLGYSIQFRMGFSAIIPIVYKQMSYEFVWSMLGAFLFIFLLRFAHGSDL
ncbi:MAG: hypothetical protein ABI210_08000 [Abditibacteriaceae bacterium]